MKTFLKYLGAGIIAFTLTLGMLYECHGFEIQAGMRTTIHAESNSQFEVGSDETWFINVQPFDNIGFYTGWQKGHFSRFIAGQPAAGINWHGPLVGWRQPLWKGFSFFAEGGLVFPMGYPRKHDSTKEHFGSWEEYQYLFQYQYDGIGQEDDRGRSLIKFNEYKHVMKQRTWTALVGIQYDYHIYKGLSAGVNVSYRYMRIKERIYGSNPPYEDAPGERHPGTPGHWLYDHTHDASGFTYGFQIKLEF